MKSLTIHNIEEDVYKVLKKQATEQGTSLNKLIKKYLRQALGLDKSQTKKRDVSFLVGSMSDEELKEFNEAISVFDQIDESEW